MCKLSKRIFRILFRADARAVLSVLLALLFLSITGTAVAKHPLAPMDTSSPRATLESFVAGTEELGRYYDRYRDSPNRKTQNALSRATVKVVRLLDLSEVPPASRPDVGDETYALLWEVIARIELPEPAEIPGAAAGRAGHETASLPIRWRIPGTDISIARVEEGPRAGEYLFSPETVKRAQEFFKAVRDLPYLRPVPIKNLHWTDQLLTGWMIPMTWVEAIPGWANTLVLGQVLWKWVGVLLLVALAFGPPLGVFRWSRRRPGDDSLRSHLRRLCTPLSILAFTAAARYLMEEQLNTTGTAASVPLYFIDTAKSIAWVWIIWLSANWTAGFIISSPRISSRGVDAQLIRFTARCAGLLAATVIVFRMAASLGIPVYGLVAGAGVGGIAIALATKGTLENFVGTLHLFGDRPVRVGDLCRFDDNYTAGSRPIGRVESIGLRSTRIRAIDRSLITIPNAELAQRQIINFSVRDRILMTTTLGFRYETTHDQLRFLLAKLRELLHAHPKTVHTKREPIRVRFVGYGDYSLNVEIRAFLKTTDYSEFLAIQEDILLRCMGVVDASGTSFAFPSRTLYHTRDGGLDIDRQRDAENDVQTWVAAQTLPFPDVTDDQRKQLSGTLCFPPEGSPDAEKSMEQK